MACSKCGKGKKNKKGKKKLSKKVNKKEEKHDLLYIMNPNCGWCKKSDPVVEALIKDGYEITTLDVTKPDEAERANEIKTKHNAQCGTPLFLDAETGNRVCGFREDVLENWAKGEEIPAPPPRPQQQPQQQPQQPQQPTGPQKYKLEYIWMDGNDTKNIRSKVRYQMINPTGKGGILESIPEWGFDGSSTNQAETEDSDCILKPVRIFVNAADGRGQGQMPSLYVLCEVYNSDGTPHKSNSRTRLQRIMDTTKDEGMWVSVEQEYVTTDPITGLPLGWSDYDSDTPPPQGNYYCGVGSETNKGKNLAELHANICLQSGLSFDGFHSEVMLSQWEYQLGTGSPLDIADQLWFSRFLLQRLGERTNISISYDPKPIKGDWNGSGAHINFSTSYMREEADMDYMNLLCANLQETHKKAIDAYGKGNKKRLTGKNETSSAGKYTWGTSDRSASIRIPLYTIKGNGLGYLEDRRPAANMDPYIAFSYLVSAVSHINEDLLMTT